jgi:CIC family chloride channel protein
MGAMSDLTVLRRLTTQDVELKIAPVVHEYDSAQKLLTLMEQTGTSDFIVTNDSGHYLGMVVSDDFREALVYRESIPLLQVSELTRNDLPTISLEETLDMVLDKFSRSDVHSLVVLDEKDKITGLITRSRLMARYQKALNADVDQ